MPVLFWCALQADTLIHFCEWELTIFPVLCAFCAIFTWFFHWDQTSKVIETSSDVEKEISILEIQWHGAMHNHSFIPGFIPNSVLIQKPYGNCGTLESHVNLQWVRIVQCIASLLIMTQSTFQLELYWENILMSCLTTCIAWCHHWSLWVPCHLWK